MKVTVMGVMMAKEVDIMVAVKASEVEVMIMAGHWWEGR